MPGHATTPAARLRLRAELDRLNRERREIEADMQEDALAALDAMAAEEACSLTLFDPGWHQGVIGIVACRLKERFHRPAIAFARGNAGEIKGSGRSIPGLHLRDALDLVAKRHPGLILKFGGHAAAAGLTLRESDFGRFRAAFEETARTLLTPADLLRVIETDGALDPAYCNLETRGRARRETSGDRDSRRPASATSSRSRRSAWSAISISSSRSKRGALAVEAIRFQRPEALPPRIRAVYAPEVNEYQRHAIAAAHDRALGAGGLTAPEDRVASGRRNPCMTLYNCSFSGSSAWNPSASTPSRNAWTTSKPAPPSCGGIFDFDDKERRLARSRRSSSKTRRSGAIPSARRSSGEERKLLEGVVSAR